MRVPIGFPIVTPAWSGHTGRGFHGHPVAAPGWPADHACHFNIVDTEETKDSTSTGDAGPFSLEWSLEQESDDAENGSDVLGHTAAVEAPSGEDPLYDYQPYRA